jgi:NTP pyrophosphatase (non-canonical NTP hydrolase)
MKMKIENYVQLSGRTDVNYAQLDLSDIQKALTHAAFGLSTESGEIVDTIKKNIFYGQPLDIDNIREEIGDLMWYVAILSRHLEIDIPEVLEENINKLKKRYPKGFTEEHAKERLDKKEIVVS